MYKMTKWLWRSSCRDFYVQWRVRDSGCGFVGVEEDAAMGTVSLLVVEDVGDA